MCQIDTPDELKCVSSQRGVEEDMMVLKCELVYWCYWVWGCKSWIWRWPFQTWYSNLAYVD
jgi:hypothetical protein